MSLNPNYILLASSLALCVGAALAVIWIGPAWDLVSSKQIRDLTPRMQALRLSTDRLPQYLRWWGLSMVAIVLLLIKMIPIAIAVVYLIYIAPRIILELLIARRRRLLRDQMVGASIGMANAARAGLSLAHGIESVCEDLPTPLKTEFDRITFEWKAGRPLIDAISDVQRRLDLDSFTLFALAISACLERGGNVSEALDRISHSLAENQRLERKLEADTASGRKVVVILAAFPLVFLGGFYFMDTQTTVLLFNTLVGQLVMLVVIALVYVSARWCQSILNIDI